MMDNDDRPVGRVLSRREALALLGAGGAALLAACAGIPETGQATSAPTLIATQAAGLPVTAAKSLATSAAANPTALPACVVTPEMTEGPYFVDEQLNRADIRSDPASGAVKEGAPLDLALRVYQVGSGSCVPLAGAVVDIWHCDAQGVYSDVQDQGFNTVGEQFLRGYQVTDANGVARFTTIYPGWYQGRTVHIHFKIRSDPSASPGYEFTSQLFFDDSLSDQVYTQAAYAGKGERQTRNANDGIFANGGQQLTLPVTGTADGYSTIFDIGIATA